MRVNGALEFLVQAMLIRNIFVQPPFIMYLQNSCPLSKYPGFFLWAENYVSKNYQCTANPKSLWYYFCMLIKQIPGNRTLLAVNYICCHIESHWRKEQDPQSSANPRIRIRNIAAFLENMPLQAIPDPQVRHNSSAMFSILWLICIRSTLLSRDCLDTA